MSWDVVAWTPVTNDVPDDERTVLISCPDEAEPVWLGYRDGDQWFSVEGGLPVRVTHWMPIPDAPEDAA